MKQFYNLNCYLLALFSGLFSAGAHRQEGVAFLPALHLLVALYLLWHGLIGLSSWA
jgi:hypothetical protein